jgi:membrane associated rhomboid family serine protease
MFPLKDDVPSRRFPVLTVILIGLNILAFLWELRVGSRLDEFLLDFSVIPARYTVPEISQLFSVGEQLIPLFTSMFLHGGWLHLIGNMWTLWIFGDNAEDRLGRGRYLFLYLIGGVTAGVVHIYTNAGSTLPTIGASGAVAAVMGAYFRLYPHANVAMIVPPFILGPVFVVPAVIFLGWWFILQFFNGTLSLLSASSLGGIAW